MACDPMKGELLADQYWPMMGTTCRKLLNSSDSVFGRQNIHFIGRISILGALTVVFPVPGAPAMAVTSPYRKPPSSASRSMSRLPQLAGGGFRCSCSSSLTSNVDPMSTGAVNSSSSIKGERGLRWYALCVQIPRRCGQSQGEGLIRGKTI